MCLIKNNARVAAQIAVALGQVQSDCGGGGKLHVVKGDEASSSDDGIRKEAPVVIGGSILDVHYRVLEDNLEVSSKDFSPSLYLELKVK